MKNSRVNQTTTCCMFRNEKEKWECHLVLENAKQSFEVLCENIKSKGIFDYSEG
jgi:hypothetical protein